MKTPLAPEPNPNAQPSHAEIAVQARNLWSDSQCPGGRDVEIWLEAERRLTSSRHVLNVSEMIENTLRQPDHAFRISNEVRPTSPRDHLPKVSRW